MEDVLQQSGFSRSKVWLLLLALDERLSLPSQLTRIEFAMFEAELECSSFSAGRESDRLMLMSWQAWPTTGELSLSKPRFAHFL